MKTDIKEDEIIIKLLHYFIVEQGYNPIVLHGAKDEIWLEKLNGDFSIVRISSSYIHNDDQLEFDFYKTKQIMKDIKKKTFLFNMNLLNIFTNLGDNVKLNDVFSFIKSVKIKDLNDLYQNKLVIDYFPTIDKKTDFKEKGMELFTKITEEIGRKNEVENKKAEEIFNPKFPLVTYVIIGINLFLFLLMYIFGNGSEDSETLIKFGSLTKFHVSYLGEYYRLITSGFLHIGIIHLAFNNYALYIIGAQIEGFFGKIKYLIIYLFSILIGNLLSLLFIEGISAGASGGIFGLLGAMVYFGYHYRVYFGTVIKSQILPLIAINLLIGFSLSGINNFAHMGGLVGGVLAAMAVGVKYKSSQGDNINGIVLTTIFTVFLIYLNFFA